MSAREYAIVVFGATGFTGELVARYLAEHMPRGQRWAIAGRSAARLSAIRRALLEQNPECAVEIVEADLDEPATLVNMAKRARVVLTTVGPYMDYGEAVVAACVKGGAHCLDITGEPEFLEAVQARYHEAARTAGLFIVHACGFGSLPPDAGAFYTVQRLPAAAEKSLCGYIWTNARPSGGTVRSILRAAAKGRLSLLGELTRPLGPPSALPRLRARIHRVPELGAWAVPTPVVDNWIVAKSVSARPEAYGPHFQYTQYLLVPNLFIVCALLLTAGVLVAAARLPPFRWLLERILVRPGGPSAAARSRMRFTMTFIGETASERVVTRISGGDPGYEEASKMLAECGLLLLDEKAANAAASGVASPIAVFGNRLIERLAERGIGFEVVEAPRALERPR